MQLTVSDVARLLGTTDEMVYRWIQTEGLPAERFNDRYLFNRVKLVEWAHAKRHPVLLELDLDMPALADPLSRGGTFHLTDARNKREALRAAIDLVPLSDDVDRDVLFDLLLAREEEGSTGFGYGIAIPHVRSPFIVQQTPPLLSIFYLENAVDFLALDALPVHTLCLLITPTNRVHLHLLSRLAGALHDEAFLHLILDRSPLDVLVARLREMDPSVDGTGAVA